MIKMNEKYVKELILLLLFAMIYTSLESNCEFWIEDDFHPFVPKSEEAREEYCGFFKEMNLSRNELMDTIRKWASKYGVLEQFDNYVDEELRYENMVYDIFKDKVNSTCGSEKIKRTLFEITDLLTDRDTAQQTIQTKIDEIINNLNERERMELTQLWAILGEEAIIEAQDKFENGNSIWEAVENTTQTDNFKSEIVKDNDKILISN
ncbi:recombinant antigen R1, identical [Brugia malayi]|uniref:Bm10631 n=1 Tax=Brugia malayi TaxID=6279 RepID=Q71TT6_BRUMA|nr:recombinant antigen R1, identical [Brugia malayi]AAQ13914.1 recombinant antigen R1 [Brugia malayi]CDQ04283.1 Bm10631 [Brugia malayi]VIO92386.1 recombinant antigen R1, identical [Brugia malayi]